MFIDSPGQLNAEHGARNAEGRADEPVVAADGFHHIHSTATRANGPFTSQPRAERGTSVALGPGANKDLQPQRGATIFLMPQSLARVVLHLAFSTKNRSSFLKGCRFSRTPAGLQRRGSAKDRLRTDPNRRRKRPRSHSVQPLSHYHGRRTRRGVQESVLEMDQRTRPAISGFFLAEWLRRIFG
jgi:hypothetical protein